MRLHSRAVRLLPLLLPMLLLPRGEAFGQSCTPDPMQVGSFPNPGTVIKEMAAVNQKLILAVNDGANGLGIWRLNTDGTFTHLSDPSWPSNVDTFGGFTVMGQQLVFVIGVQQENYLWATNDTQTAIYQVGEAFPASLMVDLGLTVVGGRLYFVAVDGHDSGQLVKLWMSDGTNVQPVPVTDNSGNELTVGETKPAVMGGKLYFSARHSTSGLELWEISQAGGPATLFEDVWQGGSSSPDSLTAVADKLYFSALDASSQHRGLFVREKETTVSRRITGPDEVGGTPGPLEDLTAVGDKLFFHFSGNSGDELWVSKGEPANAERVVEIQQGASGGSPDDLTAVGRMLFFTANDGTHGREPWRSDGTAAGTSMVDDFYRNGSNERPSTTLEMKAGAGVLLLSVYGGNAASGDRQLWSVSDTPTPRQLTSVGGPTVSDPHAMTVLGSNLYFAAKPASQPAEDELFVLGLNRVDCASPSVTCPAPLTVEAVSSAGAYVFLPPPVQMSDDSFTPLDVSYSPGPFASFGLGTSTSATLAVRDLAGNEGTCQVTVNVRDTIGPDLACPKDMTVEATGSGGAVVSFPVEAWDAVSGVQFVNASPASGWLFPKGVTPVEITAADMQNNAATPCKFNVAVKDTQPPKLSCPQDIMRVATGPEPIALTYAPPELSDASPPITLTVDPVSPHSFEVGSTRVTFTATDSVNRVESECTFSVHIVDPVAPTIACPGPQQAVATGPEGAAVEFPDVSAEDAVGPPSLSYTAQSGSTFPVGETTVTATATDGSGNKASCSFTVTVSDPDQLATPEGCACRAGSASASVYWVLLALAPLWARRRIGRLAR